MLLFRQGASSRLIEGPSLTSPLLDPLQWGGWAIGDLLFARGQSELRFPKIMPPAEAFRSQEKYFMTINNEVALIWLAAGVIGLSSLNTVQGQDVQGQNAKQSVNVFGEGKITVPADFKRVEPKSRIIQHEFQAKAGEGDGAHQGRTTGGHKTAHLSTGLDQRADEQRRLHSSNAAADGHQHTPPAQWRRQWRRLLSLHQKVLGPPGGGTEGSVRACG